jgi:hypothetical protein
MSQSIRHNVEFRKLLTRKHGALGSELQAFTGRDYVYSTWSLRTMETDTHKLYTRKEGKETRYYLWTAERAEMEAANDRKRLANAS